MPVYDDPNRPPAVPRRYATLRLPSGWSCWVVVDRQRRTFVLNADGAPAHFTTREAASAACRTLNGQGD